MNQEQEPKTFTEDGIRPIKSGEMEVADTFTEDGTRPIAKGPDFLVQNQNQADSSNERFTTDNDNEDNSQTDVVDTFEEDGIRPIKSGEMEVADTFTEDGTRPIAKGPDFLVQNQNQADSSNERFTTDNDNEDNSQTDVVDTFEEDGIRPIKSGEMEVADTFTEDGIRPIAKGPDFLVQQQGEVDSGNEDSATDDGDRVLKVDGTRPIDSSDVEVADTFEEDGTRPIMKNKYDVVDTIDTDGERPITSQ